MTLQTSFEKQTCTRCCGTGKHSYCHSHGYTCFKCGGTGEILTARGSVAHDVYASSRKVQLSEVSVGDMLRSDGRRFKVDSIKSESDGYYTFTAENGHTFGFCSGCELIKVFSPEENKKLINKALEYQGKLTKAGKLMKKFQ